MPSTNMQTFVRGMQMYPMRIMRSNNPQFDLRCFNSSSNEYLSYQRIRYSSANVNEIKKKF